MEKYDGWTIKNTYGTPWLVVAYFSTTRKEVIEDFEKLSGKGEWKKERRKGNFKIVKIKLLEVK